jgi:hypothetical protein
MSNDRDQIINAAIRDQKIRPSQRDDMERLYDTNPEAMRNLLTADVRQGGLLPGIVPAETEAAASGYDQQWLTPGERARLGQVSAAPAAPAPARATAKATSSDAYDESLLTPAERARIAAIKAGTYQQPTIQADDNYRGIAASPRVTRASPG